MRKSREEAAATRKHIISAAASEFRRKGIEATGLADLMAAAGLTHGGFYKHFDSKEQVVQESLTQAAAETLALTRDTMEAAPVGRGLEAVLAMYLSQANRDNPGCSCPFTTLATDLAHSSKAVRKTATESYLKLVDYFAAQMKGLTPAAARKQALFMISTLIGAVSMARVVTDPQLSAAILQSAHKELLQMSAAHAGGASRKIKR